MLAYIFALIAAFQTPPPANTFIDRPCADAALNDVVRCGIVRVPENRAQPGGRMIDLNVVVLPATGENPDLPPLFDLDGGPGLPATKSLGFYLVEGAAYRVRREIVLLDQRGTGRSNPLYCPALFAPAERYAEMLPPAAVARCRDALAGQADLRFYGTREAVADLDTVRAALGRDRIDIFALSYGTTLALRYMAVYPSRVRAAVLMGVAPPDAMPPRHHATAAASALGLLFEDCAAEPACRTAFPDPAGDFARARARLADGPVAPAVFAESIRTLMYQPQSARRIPWILRRAAEGDLAPFYAATSPGGPSLLSDGVFLSITCTENFGLMDYRRAAAASRATPFGDYRLRRQRAACRQWPLGTVPQEHLQPARSDTPVLIFSGRLDPVTPPDWAEAVSRNLPNSRHLVIPYSGHVFDGLSNIECFDALARQFYDSGDARALDPACLATMSPPAFASGP